MADNKRKKYETFISPSGIFKFPKLTEPDTKFKDAGEYSVKVICEPDAEGVQELIAMIHEGAKETLKAAIKGEKSAAKKKKWETKYLPYSDGLDEDDEENGTVEFNFKMTASGVAKKTGKPWKRTPALFDSKGKPLPGDVSIWGGTVGSVAFQVIPYSQTIQTGASVKLALEAVQVTSLVSGGHKDAAGYGFADEDGYEAPEAPVDLPADEAGDSDAGDDNGEGDF